MKDYVKQLKDFKQYMDACFTVLMEHGDSDLIDAFYNSDFEITFRGKKVTLYNSADVYCTIENMLQIEIDENEIEESEGDDE